MNRLLWTIALTAIVLTGCGVNVAGRFYPEETKELHFRVPDFETTPNNLNRLPRLEILSVSYGKISRVSGLEGLSNLVELNLDHNRISRIQGLSGLPSLKTLDLSYNSIERINNLDSLLSLTSLNLTHNRIETLENLESLTSLSNLYIIANPIRFVSSNTYRLLITNRVAVYAYEGSNFIDIDTLMERNSIEFLQVRPVEPDTNRTSNTLMRSNQ